MAEEAGEAKTGDLTMRLSEYTINADGIEATVIISKDTGSLPMYDIKIPKPEHATATYLQTIENDLLKSVKLSSQEVLDINLMADVKKKFHELALKAVNERIPHLTQERSAELATYIVQELLGLGDVEFLLHDDDIEEICINSSREPIWIYHKKHKWCKSNLKVNTEGKIWDYSSSIGRRVGRQISIKDPILDASLSTGDRVNATLTPISMFGNTITIRKFNRKPWTITDFIATKTISEEAAAFLWLAMQYEMNIIMSGGTASGKTSMLNAICSFMPTNQRVISIEQTREITLPSELQWVPLLVRHGAKYAEGDVTMLELMVNSLRMRPDRIIVGEIREAHEAEVLFEAMHTGHSVYATMHAETVSETLKRLESPPISIPTVAMESLHFVVSMYRNRRSGIRRVFEIGEFLPSESQGNMRTNIVFRWHANNDKLMEENPSIRMIETLGNYTQMSEDDIKATLKERVDVLRYMQANKINTIEKVGDVITEYYDDHDSLMKKVGKT